MALLMSGQAEMVIAGGVAILRGIARGAPVVVVGGHLSRMSYALIGAKGLKTVDDLKGKAIGITGIGGIGEFAVVESLKRNGLVKDRDFSLLNIEGGTAARMAALKAGKVHAVPVTPGQRVQAENDGFTILLDVRDSLADLPSNIVASTKEFAKSNPDKTIRFLRALGRAVDLIRQDKDKAISAGQELMACVETQRWNEKHSITMFRIWTSASTRTMSRALLKLLDIADPPEKFFDDTYLSRALAR